MGVIGGYGYEIAIMIDRFLKKIGYKVSLSKFAKDNVKQAVKFISNFENQLAYQALQRGLKGVICGHIHNPEIKTITIKKKKIEYLNCGDWIENNSYIVYKKNKFRLCFISDEF